MCSSLHVEAGHVRNRTTLNNNRWCSLVTKSDSIVIYVRLILSDL